MSKDAIRMSFTIPEDMQLQLCTYKKEFFYDCSNSEMIRKLITAGLKSLESSSQTEITQ